MKRNFLNNQNYILWKTEKKKLLSKFFVEIIIKKYFKIIKKVDKFVNSIYFLFILFIWFIFLIYIKNILYLYNIVLLIIFSVFYFYNIWKYKRIKTLINFIIPNNLNYIIIILKFIFFTFLIGWVIGFTYNIYLLVFFIIIIPIILSIINVFNISLILLFIPYICFYFLYSIFYIIFLKWTKWYKFQKNKPKQNILKKFNKIKKYWAENEFYKIKLKW